MSTVEINLENNPQTPEIKLSDWNDTPKSYRCHVNIIKECEGGYSVVVMNLPGTGSCGDTEEEAMENTREAIRGVVESCLARAEDVPWLDPQAYTVPEDAKSKWILVHV